MTQFYHMYLLFPHWLMENIKGSAIIANKIEFLRAEIDDRTYNWHSAFISALPGGLFAWKVCQSVFYFYNFCVQIPTGVRDYNLVPTTGPGPCPGPSLTNRNNGHNMDVIDTTLRLGMTSGSREKLNPKHGFDEEQVG